MVKDFDKVINERVNAIRQLIAELNKVCDQNVEMAAVREDTQRIKIAIDLAKRDILQKQQVSQELRGEIEEVKAKNEELDEEIRVYEDKFNK
jgi:chromosome segregation ATPase